MFYVYIYRDPNGIPIYVGAGRGNRYLVSLWNANSINSGTFGDKVTPWLRFLASEITHGRRPTIEFVESNLADKELALLLEADYIAHFKRIGEGGTLHNVLQAAGRGWGMTSEDRKRFGADQEWEAKRRAAITKAFENDSYRERNATVNAERARMQVNDPSWITKQKAGCQKKLQDPEYLAKRKAADNDPDRRRKISEAKKAWWVKRRADPEAYARTVGKMLNAMRKPTT